MLTEKQKLKRREYWHKNREVLLKKRREYYQKNKDKFKAYKKAHKTQSNRWQKAYNKKIKLQVLSHYSNGKLVCNCCKEAEIGFLSIDHINNDGYKYKKLNRGNHVYERLYRSNYPVEEKIQVLCFNCNLGRQINNHICPHKSKSPKGLEEVTSQTLYPCQPTNQNDRYTKQRPNSRTSLCQ